MPYYMPLANPQRKRVFAQLKSYTHRGLSTDVNEGEGEIVINFPAMPETIELARRANYNNTAANSPANPDGFHVYRNTDPLKIPIKFSAHAFDVDYTHEDGPVVLLQIAARLHALTLPIFKGTATAGTFYDTTPAPPDAPPAAGSDKPEDKKIATSLQGANVVASNPNQIYFPVPCVLNIMLARWRGKVEYGICCFGFVEDVAVTLRGPWLQGRAAGGNLDDLRNLPSSVDYAFTFVHQPGYTNNMLGGSLAGGGIGQVGGQMVLQAMAGDVYRRFFNQAQLDKLSTKPQGYMNLSTAEGVNVFGLQK